MNKYIKFSAVAALALGMTACTSKFDEINTDPDAYSEVPTSNMTNMLANCLQQSADYWGDELSRLTDWAGYMVASYDNEKFQYYPSNNEFGNKWYQTYTLQPQLQYIMDNIDHEAFKNMYNAAKMYQQYLYLLNVDCFGDCPYSEAAKASVDGTSIKPKFDKDEDVYAGIEKVLKEVADSWAEGIGDDELGSGDLLYGGDVTMWQRWCNSLRLRVAMRLSGMASHEAKSKATFEEILNNPAKYPVIEECDQNCYFWWDGSSSYREPWYDNKLERSVDYCMGQVLVDHLKNQGDPRLYTICKPAVSDGEYRGVLHGSSSQYNGKGYSTYSQAADMYYGNASGFSPYFRAAETWFLIEEAKIKGWNVPYDAKEAYETAVKCSMEDNGVTAEEAALYLEGKGAYDGSLKQLYTEEWVALYKQSQEAWCLQRRTGYPTELFDEVTYATGVTCAQYPGERNVWGYGASATHNDLPWRFPYPQSEFNYNYDNVTAASEGIVNYCWGKRLCWAKDNGRK